MESKKDLLERYEELCLEKEMYIKGISYASKKCTIKNAIDCLECPDETLEEYLIIFKHHYVNLYKKIKSVGYLKHPHNRFFIFNNVKALLKK